MDGLGYRPRVVLAFATGGDVFNPGVPGPRTNAETMATVPRVWPTCYQIPQRGMGPAAVAYLPTPNAIVNNRIAGGAPGYNIMMPGLSKSPFGG